MPTWNADQYLKFAEERTQPCRDLAARISVASVSGVRTVIDLGCGPGNSTTVIAQRWLNAEITCLDNSLSMIEAARRERPQFRWVLSDITQWAGGRGEQFDVVFSNASLQWVTDHASVYPKLFARVAPGGAFAAQIPADFNSRPHQLMREIASPRMNVMHVKE